MSSLQHSWSGSSSGQQWSSFTGKAFTRASSPHGGAGPCRCSWPRASRWCLSPSGRWPEELRVDRSSSLSCWVRAWDHSPTPGPCFVASSPSRRCFKVSARWQPSLSRRPSSPFTSRSSSAWQGSRLHGQKGVPGSESTACQAQPEESVERMAAGGSCLQIRGSCGRRHRSLQRLGHLASCDQPSLQIRPGPLTCDS